MVASPSRATKRVCRRSVEGTICLLFVVVRMRDRKESEDGRNEATRSVRSVRLDVAGSENETVDGSDRPGKVDSRMFTFGDAILDVKLEGVDDLEGEEIRCHEWIPSHDQRIADSSWMSCDKGYYCLRPIGLQP